MNVLFLTFYFEPDIGPGAFRTTSLVRELANQLGPESTVQVITTSPNRYQSFRPPAPDREEWGETICPVTIERIPVPVHASDQRGQIRAFWRYYRAVHGLTRYRRYDLVVASSSRLFTAFLAAQVARNQRVPLFLDIRDLFREAILDTLGRSWVRCSLNPVLRAVEQYTFGRASHINLISAGFTPYFTPYPKAAYSYFTNGIDDLFLSDKPPGPPPASGGRSILYLGNIGEGQGLHTIIPQAAQQLGNAFQFVIIGSGGARHKLEKAIREAGVTNVELRNPVSRAALLNPIQQADYLFLHLSDLAACKRVLPSKLFEYGATDKPILAGVAGYAASFIREHLTNCMVFAPGNAEELVRQLHETPYRIQSRAGFSAQFQRRAISRAMVQDMIKLVETESGEDHPSYS